MDEPVTGGNPTAPEANESVALEPDTASKAPIEPEPTLVACEVPEMIPVELMVPVALDTDTLDPDSAIVRTTAPLAELAVADEPTRTALRLRVPLASEADWPEPDMPYTWASVPLPAIDAVVSASPEIGNTVPPDGAAGITGRPGPRQTFPERLI